MPLAYNEKTGEVLIYWTMKFISKEDAMKMLPKNPSASENCQDSAAEKKAADHPESPLPDYNSDPNL